MIYDSGLGVKKYTDVKTWLMLISSKIDLNF
jgi:hypothetical protein